MAVPVLKVKESRLGILNACVEPIEKDERASGSYQKQLVPERPPLEKTVHSSTADSYWCDSPIFDFEDGFSNVTDMVAPMELITNVVDIGLTEEESRKENTETNGFMEKLIFDGAFSPVSSNSLLPLFEKRLTNSFNESLNRVEEDKNPDLIGLRNASWKQLEKSFVDKSRRNQVSSRLKREWPAIGFCISCASHLCPTYALASKCEKANVRQSSNWHQQFRLLTERFALRQPLAANEIDSVVITDIPASTPTYVEFDPPALADCTFADVAEAAGESWIYRSLNTNSFDEGNDRYAVNRIVVNYLKIENFVGRFDCCCTVGVINSYRPFYQFFKWFSPSSLLTCEEPCDYRIDWSDSGVIDHFNITHPINIPPSLKWTRFLTHPDGAVVYCLQPQQL